MTLFPANGSLTVNAHNISFTLTDMWKTGFRCMFIVLGLVFFFTSGNFEVGVHIADVSYFVEGGSALDIIASQRATSVYLVQKVSTPQRMFINDALKRLLVDICVEC